VIGQIGFISAVIGQFGTANRTLKVGAVNVSLECTPAADDTISVWNRIIDSTTKSLLVTYTAPGVWTNPVPEYEGTSTGDLKILAPGLTDGTRYECLTTKAVSYIANVYILGSVQLLGSPQNNY